MGRVVLAVLGHRDRDRDLRWSAPRAACRPRAVHQQAVHGVRGRRARSTSPSPACWRRCSRRWPRPGSACSPSRRSTPTGSSCPVGDADRAADEWRRRRAHRRPGRPRHAPTEAHQMTVTAPPASGPPASPPDSSPPAPRTSPWSSTTAPPSTPPRCSPPTAARPTRCSGAGRWSRTASSARSSSTPAAPTATPVRRASRPRTPSPSGSPAHLGIGAVDVVVCSTGLIGLANDRAARCSPASTRRTPRWPPTAAPTRPGRS